MSDVQSLLGERLLLTPLETAELLGIGRSKVFALLATGELRSIRLGRSRRILRVSLDELVARLEADQSAASA
jgi:excisionase family DNA binding protein